MLSGSSSLSHTIDTNSCLNTTQHLSLFRTLHVFCTYLANLMCLASPPCIEFKPTHCQCSRITDYDDKESHTRLCRLWGLQYCQETSSLCWNSSSISETISQLILYLLEDQQKEKGKIRKKREAEEKNRKIRGKEKKEKKSKEIKRID